MAFALLLLSLLSPAHAGPARRVELTPTGLQVESVPLRVDPMAGRLSPWPATSGEAVDGSGLEGRRGKGPWRLFEGIFDEGACRWPQVASGGSLVVSVCPGLDSGSPSDRHLVWAREGVLSRYRRPIMTSGERRPFGLVSTGDGLALLADGGQGKAAVHLVDLEAGADRVLRGEWSDPSVPVGASASGRIAFVARLGNRRQLIVVDAEREEAFVVKGVGQARAVWGLSADGEQLVVSSDTQDRAQLLAVDLRRRRVRTLSHRRSVVSSAAVDPSGQAVVFAGELGGIGGLYWADLGSGRRTELLSNLDERYRVLAIDSSRRVFLFSQKRSGKEKFLIRDRRSGETLYRVPGGCLEPALSPDGRVMGVHCPRARLGSGSFLFVVPPPREDPS